nr:ribonuclease H-like domain-containing protein [Tanacetum cinerariifolium]
MPTTTQSSTTQHEPADQPPIIIPDPPENPNPVSVHPNVTRFRVETNRPTNRLTLHVSSVSPLLKSYRDAFSDPNWQNVMRDEYHALIKNKTWKLVPRPPDTNIVRCMWLFRYKYLANGTLSRYKARLVANGSTQLEGVGVDETFSLVVNRRIIRSLHQEFAMTDLGPLNYFLGISVTRDSSGLFLSQKKYAVEILEKAHMGSLQYLTFTRPDISYAVQQVYLYMHDPREPHLSPFKRILRYVQGALHYGLQLFSSSTTNLVAYSDADWAGCPTILGDRLQAEYRGVANAVAETCWLRNLLRELHTPLSSATLVYCDYVSAVYLSCNPIQHQRTKHIEIDIHFVRDLVAAGQVRVLHMPSRYDFADIFTKGLSSALFEEFRSRLSVRCPSAQTARKC